MTTTSDESIYTHFERIARAHPDQEAIGGAHDRLTYRALDEYAGRIAQDLLGAAVQPGDRVALLFDREPAAFAAILGVFKIGAIVVPLVPSHPEARLRQIVHEAEPSVLVTGERGLAAAHVLAGPRCPILNVERALPSSAHHDVPAVDPRSAAIILFTSGSTGLPKGVLQSHRFVLQKLGRVSGQLQRFPGDRMTFFSSYSTGQGFTNIMLALLSGAALCPFDIRRETPDQLVRWMNDERITIYISSASLLRSFMRTLDGGARFDALRIVRVGGERVVPDDVAACRRLFPGARMLVNYTCMESGAIALHPIEPNEPFADGIVPVGRPLPGIVVRILGEDGREVEQGEEGEITVQSVHLSSGYWRDPERTARAFELVDGDSGERCYRTGDLGRLRADGQLEHLGRKDLRVKIRGFRIELEEVESALNQDPLVLLSAAAAKPDSRGDLRLVAYIQVAPAAALTVDTLRARLAMRLPEHMIPSAFVVLDEIPLTASGKIAREALPEPSFDRSTLAPDLVLPRTRVEAAIADIWREVLGLEHVGVDDAFLSVGGDSLKATLVMSRLSARLGVDIRSSLLFEASTVAEMARLLEQQMDEPGSL